MSRLSLRTLTTMALLFLGVALPSGDAVGQEKTLKEQLVGTWTLVSADTVNTDGSREPIYGPNPKGLAVFDSNGHYIFLNGRSGQPKFASNNRMEGTPEEYKAVVQGMNAHFGRYTVNETDKAIIFYIETSMFPNWNGIEQKRPFTLIGDELKWATVASGGGLAEVVLRRSK